MASKGRTVERLVLLLLAAFVLLEALVEAGDKGRDIIIWNGKVIVKSGKKKGNIIISNGDGHHAGHGQGKFKYNKKYMNYGGFWRR